MTRAYLLNFTIWICVAVTFGSSPAAFAQERRMVLKGDVVSPAYEGWWPNADGTFKLFFGYMNTNWQQQFPINQEYNGTNSWSIPINPEFSENPLSSESNFMKGAMAIAINEIPIFNALNNRGEDANLIGELDKWGGHCGKADDYHYHLPPTHLSDIVGADNPIAYSLDGFPIFGKTNNTLDENLGLLNKDGSYSYFTVEYFPYFISKMKGKVTTSGSAPENQIVPQAQSKGIRPALTPLNGSEIRKFLTTGKNSYQLIYNLNKQEYTIDYLWDNAGHYFITFTDPDGTSKTETYHR